MADHAVGPDHDRKTRVGVERRIVLNLAALAELDPFVVATEHRPEPDAGVGLQPHPPDHGCAVGDPTASGKIRPFAVKLVDGHGRLHRAERELATQRIDWRDTRVPGRAAGRPSHAIRSMVHAILGRDSLTIGRRWPRSPTQPHRASAPTAVYGAVRWRCRSHSFWRWRSAPPGSSPLCYGRLGPRRKPGPMRHHCRSRSRAPPSMCPRRQCVFLCNAAPAPMNVWISPSCGPHSNRPTEARARSCCPRTHPRQPAGLSTGYS